jgi:hypothetical protein
LSGRGVAAIAYNFGATPDDQDALGLLSDCVEIPLAQFARVKRVIMLATFTGRPGVRAVPCQRLVWSRVLLLAAALHLMSTQPSLAASVRIVALGSSTTAGFSYSQAIGYPARLEALLRARGYVVPTIGFKLLYAFVILWLAAQALLTLLRRWQAEATEAGGTINGLS